MTTSPGPYVQTEAVDTAHPPRSCCASRAGDAGVLSGLMRGADQWRNRPALVDAPVGKGRVLLYVVNPI